MYRFIVASSNTCAHASKNDSTSGRRPIPHFTFLLSFSSVIFLGNLSNVPFCVHIAFSVEFSKPIPYAPVTRNVKICVKCGK